MIADAYAEIRAYRRYKVFPYEVVARHEAYTGLNTESPSFAIAILRNGGVDKAVELAECHVFVLTASDDLIVFCEIDFERNVQVVCELLQTDIVPMYANEAVGIDGLIGEGDIYQTV